MNLDKKTITKASKDFTKKYKKYASFAFILIILLMYTFLVYRISKFSLAEPNTGSIEQQLQSSGKLKIDQDSINKILKLEEQNVNVQSLFEGARDNPFEDS